MTQEKDLGLKPRSRLELVGQEHPKQAEDRKHCTG